MKPVPVISLLVWLLLIGSTTRSQASESPFHFEWEAQSLDVVEKCTQPATVVALIHHGQLVKTNDGFVLQWSPPTITEINGEKVSGSKAWQTAAVALAKSRLYPAFHISDDGEFIEAISAGTPAKSESENDDLNALYEVIWQTWVGAWTEVELADGKSESVGGTAEYAEIEVPVTNKTTNLGSTTADTNLVSLKFEQTVSGTNFQSVLNGLLAEGLEIKTAGPVTNDCSLHRSSILEVQTERQTLKPHWARRTTKTTYSIPGEQIETESEIREFHFQWGQTNAAAVIQQP